MKNYKIILPGVPAYPSRGFLGWCTVALIESDKRVLFDTGSYGDRFQLLETLEKNGIRRDEIDIVFLSHLHYDHCINAELFPDSKILLSDREWEYFESEEYKEVGDEVVPEGVIREFEDRIETTGEEEEIAEGVEVVEFPGHTPGSSALLFNEILFTGDAVKNLWDFKNRSPPYPTFSDEDLAVENYELVREIAEIVVPGHDTPFSVNEERYLSDFNLLIEIETLREGIFRIKRRSEGKRM
jgi:glyoxylase-like metal-dependent hydrolase (beta-lactamase superfamily II)